MFDCTRTQGAPLKNSFGCDPWFTQNVKRGSNERDCFGCKYKEGQYKGRYTIAKTFKFYNTQFESCFLFDMIVKTVMTVVCLVFQIIETAVVLAISPLLLAVDCLHFHCECNSAGLIGREILAVAELALEIFGHVFVEPVINFIAFAKKCKS